MEQVCGILAMTSLDNSSLSHNDLRKNTFLILGEETTDDINSTVGTVEKK